MNIDGYDVETPFWDVHPKVPSMGSNFYDIKRINYYISRMLDNTIK